MSDLPKIDFPGLTARAEAEADAAFRLRLFRQSRPLEAMLGHLPEAVREQLMRDQFRLQTIGHDAAFPNARRLILELDGTPAGRVMLDVAGAIHIVDLAILPERRGSGLGGAVLRAVIAMALDRGCCVDLTVAGENEAAQRLYARMGFVATERRAADIAMRWGRVVA